MSRVIILIITVLFLQYINTVSIKIEAGQNECFYETATKKLAKVHVNFQVVEGGYYDIDVEVSDPHDKLIHKTERQSSGKIEFQGKLFFIKN